MLATDCLPLSLHSFEVQDLLLRLCLSYILKRRGDPPSPSRGLPPGLHWWCAREYRAQDCLATHTSTLTGIPHAERAIPVAPPQSNLSSTNTMTPSPGAPVVGLTSILSLAICACLLAAIPPYALGGVIFPSDCADVCNPVQANSVDFKTCQDKCTVKERAHHDWKGSSARQAQEVYGAGLNSSRGAQEKAPLLKVGGERASGNRTPRALLSISRSTLEGASDVILMMSPEQWRVKLTDTDSSRVVSVDTGSRLFYRRLLTAHRNLQANM